MLATSGLPLPRTRWWRVLIALPPDDGQGQFEIMRRWLDNVCGPGAWQSAPAGRNGIVNDAVAFYFADQALARAFVGRFACGYRPAPRAAL
jgi:hypothetical protein